MHVEKSSGQELIKAVREAGARLTSLWPGGSPTEKIEIIKKEDGSPVTSADFESNSILTTALTKLFPNDLILSEEGPKIEIPKKGRIWIIDPLDGTRRFIEGQDDFCILVSLMVNGVPEEGIVYFPISNLFFASFDLPTIKNCKLSKEIRSGRVYVSGPNLKDQSYSHSGALHTGAAFLKLIEGEIDAFALSLVKPSEWDIAAPHAVISKIGGRVGQINGQPLDYGGAEWSKQLAVASSIEIHDGVLDLFAGE